MLGQGKGLVQPEGVLALGDLTQLVRTPRGQD